MGIEDNEKEKILSFLKYHCKENFINWFKDKSVCNNLSDNNFKYDYDIFTNLFKFIDNSDLIKKENEINIQRKEIHMLTCC